MEVYDHFFETNIKSKDLQKELKENPSLAVIREIIISMILSFKKKSLIFVFFFGMIFSPSLSSLVEEVDGADIIC